MMDDVVLISYDTEIVSSFLFNLLSIFCSCTLSSVLGGREERVMALSTPPESENTHYLSDRFKNILLGFWGDSTGLTYV